MANSIRLENYSKVIKGKTILDNINLNIKSGMVYKISGINGSGKTMLLRAISGLMFPTSGRLLVNEVTYSKKTKYSLSLGVMIENPKFWNNYTGKEILTYLAKIRNVITEAEIDYAMKRVGLDPDDKRNIDKYSLGMKQRLGIAQAIMEKPDVILLDEPLNALDKNGITQFEKIIIEEKKRGSIIVLALHNEGKFSFEYDEVFEIEEGKII